MRTRNIILGMALGLGLAGSALGAASLSTHLYINGVEGQPIMPREPAVVELQFVLHQTDAEPKPVVDIKPIMGKVMHFVAIKKDLSEFAHFHPSLDPGTGLFQIPVHLPMYHPDNVDAQNAFPSAGEYLIYAETVSTSLGMVMRGVDYRTFGQATEKPLVVDTPNADGVYKVYLTADNEPGQAGDKYKADIHFETISGAGGDLINIYMTVSAKGTDGTYAEVDKLQPWLMMGGHAILVSEAGDGVAEKTFAHFHGDLPAEGGQVKFNHFVRGGLAAGTYKVWMQVKHDGLILKVPLVFEY